nr:MAG TPA: hypothetical protein [Caudoviricetes sp.]
MEEIKQALLIIKKECVKLDTLNCANCKVLKILNTDDCPFEIDNMPEDWEIEEHE